MIYIQRRKKIRKQYQLAFSILFDKITLWYLIPLFFVGILLFKETIQGVAGSFNALNQFNYTISILFPFILSLFYLYKSLFDPRYKVTSSDFHLSLLPYDIEKVIKIIVLHEQLKRLIVFFISIICFYWLGIFSLKTGLLLTVSFGVTDFLSGLIQWRTFQRNIKAIIARILGGTVIAAICLAALSSFLIEISSIFFLYYIVSCGALAVFLFSRTLTSQVNWKQVILTGDEKTWNLLIVKLITGIGFNHIERTGRLPGVAKETKNDQPPYELTSVLALFWKRYFLLNKASSFHVLGNCLAILLFLSLSINLPSGLNLSIPAVVGMYLLYGIFKSNLETTRFQVLPGSISSHVDAFYRVTYWFFLTLLGAHSLFLGINSSFPSGMIPVVILGEWLVVSYTYKTILKLGISSFFRMKQQYRAFHLFTILFFLTLLTMLELFPLISFFIVGIFLVKLVAKRRYVGVLSFQFMKK
ncbi:hypothetical protein ACFOGI_05330 [Virgibacillus xinjiangensis]|uniref:ABC-2 type transport system permease protein n=1 Tax=Virgibacillus xinjiangensis TaxID=393090 RepID=A0ABV7CT89_9BACI